MNDELLRQWLDATKTIAVVGFSAQTHKPSFFVAKYLQMQGFRVIPINPGLAGQATGLMGEVCYASLTEAKEKGGHSIDLVDVFRRPEYVMPVVQEAAAIGAKTVWLQQGIEHPQAMAWAQDRGLNFIMDACLKVEHARLYNRTI